MKPTLTFIIHYLAGKKMRGEKWKVRNSFYRTSFCRLFLTALLFAPLSALHAADASKPSRKPNIILVMPDDTGYGDYACLGNPVTHTPVVDAFKKQSLLFTQFHVSPTCSPCRSALMSGRHEFKNGVTHTIGGRERMTLNTFTLSQMLKSVGYTSGIFGKWHLGDEHAYRPESRGFDEVYIHGSGGIGQSGDAPGNNNINPTLWHNGKFEKTRGYCTDLFFAQAIKWMDGKREAKQPFFAYIPLNAAHAPHVVPADYYKQYVGKPKVSEEVAKYFGMLENIDTNFGALLAKLDEWGIADNTLVIYLGTDNGATAGRNIFNAGMKGGKATPYQGGTRAPAFFRWPAGGIPAGAECDALSAHLDLFPTLAEITGAKMSDEVQKQVEGRSLWPLLKNPKGGWADRTLVHHVGRWPTGKAEQSKYEKCAIQNSHFTLVNNAELYDLKTDPGESTNIIAEHPEVVAQLRAAYDQWWLDVQPLLVNEKVTGFNNYTFRELYVKQFGTDSIKGMKSGESDTDAEGDSRSQQMKRREERKQRKAGTPDVPEKPALEGKPVNAPSAAAPAITGEVPANKPSSLITYKTASGVDLKLHVFNPKGHQPSDHSPAIVLFFGGGWSGGQPEKLYGQCAYFASKGMVAMSADYRVKGRNRTTPVECVKDGKSAIRWIRSHAGEMGIDPDKVVAGGASAGGHVAAATGTEVPFNEETDDLSVSARPNALVLFNPVFDNGPSGYGHDRVADYWEKISPMHNINAGTPPTIAFFGDQDEHVPVATAQEYKKRMEDKGSRCDLFIYPGQAHGFFNYRPGNEERNPYFKKTVEEAAKFLNSAGILK